MSVPATAPTRPGTARWRAIGCDVQVSVTDPAALDTARAVVVAEVDALDLAASRFRDDSDLARVNASGGRAVAVGPLLIEALTAALDAARSTDGDVDPTLGGTLVDLGYDRTFTQVAPDGPAVRLSTHRAADWRDVVVDPAAGTVAVPDGVLLDLGATAKAFGADRAAAAASAATGTGVLVSLGGDVATAGAAPLLAEPDGRVVAGWPVRVQDVPGPLDAVPEGPSTVVTLASGGIATSSVTARRWARGGRLLHHVIDPRTSMPALTPWRTVTVAAPTCLAANIVTTAAVVRGERALAWLEELGATTRLVGDDGHVRSLGGWPDEPVDTRW